MCALVFVLWVYRGISAACYLMPKSFATLFLRPCFVVGTPVAFAILRFAFVMPNALFQLKDRPGIFGIITLPQYRLMYFCEFLLFRKTSAYEINTKSFLFGDNPIIAHFNRKATQTLGLCGFSAFRGCKSVVLRQKTAIQKLTRFKKRDSI